MKLLTELLQDVMISKEDALGIGVSVYNLLSNKEYQGIGCYLAVNSVFERKCPAKNITGELLMHGTARISLHKHSKTPSQTIQVCRTGCLRSQQS